MKIYTKFGDKGETVLFDGTCVGKDHLRIQTYGALDELNSALGLAISGCRDEGLREVLFELQRQIFTASADLATPQGSANERKITRVSPAEIELLERAIDATTETLPPLKKFILPGGGETASRLHVARTICRRAERLLVTLMTSEPDGGESIGPHLLIYLNRMSDLLFTLARRANAVEAIADIEWDGKKA